MRHRVRPLIVVAGPSGTGKTIIAKRIAQMITRAEQGPNVLLVDADIYNRGLTAQFDGGGEIPCGYLHDAVLGGNPGVESIEFAEGLLETDKDWPLSREGHVFFLPSIRRNASNPFQVIKSLDHSSLRSILFRTIDSAADRCDAQCIVIDTTSIPEPCAAILASVCNLIVLVGKEDRALTVIWDHHKRLKELEPQVESSPVKEILNQINIHPTVNQAGALHSVAHLIPALHGLQKVGAERVIDCIELNTYVTSILAPFFNQTNPALTPLWHAPLLPDWRMLGCDSSSAFDLLPFFTKRAVTTVWIGLPGLFCVLLAVASWSHLQAAGPTGRILLLLGAITGSFALGFSAVAGVRAVIDFRNCRAAVSHLAKKDLGWFLARLRLSPRQLRRAPPEKRARLAQQRLKSLHNISDILSRCVRKSERREGV